jgi:hypothetical protein
MTGRTRWLALLCGIGMAAAAREGAAGREGPGPPLALKVAGMRLVDSRDRPVLLRGVNTAGLEWSNNGEGRIVATVKTAIRDWKVNHVRLPLAQDRWFGKAPGQTDEGKAYRAIVREIVDHCAEQGCYLLLDLHWSDAGEWGKQIGQHVLPDQNSLAFWKDVAAAYKDHPAVLFDLYNEPHDVSWEAWRDGGLVTERERRTRRELTFLGVGMQPLLDAVRSTGARNVVIVGGLDWAYDFSGILNGKQLVDPTGNGVVYANHAYPIKGENVAAWIARMETAAKQLPVIVSEFGSEPQGGAGLTGEEWNRQVLQALRDHRWSWTAWDLHPAAGPRLVADWDYTPTPFFGALVKEALLVPAAPPAPASPGE